MVILMRMIYKQFTRGFFVCAKASRIEILFGLKRVDSVYNNRKLFRLHKPGFVSEEHQSEIQIGTFNLMYEHTPYPSKF